MRIRRNAFRLAGSPVCVSPRFEWPPPFKFELPPPADESHHARFLSKISSSSSQEPCEESFSPWDLMDQLDLSDPQEEENFMEAYSMPIKWQASSLFAPTMPSIPIENEELEKEHMAIDMVNGVLLELQHAKNSKAARNKKKPSGSLKPRRKRLGANLGVDAGFYYYTGLGQSRSTKRQRSMLKVPTLPAQDKEEAHLPEDQHTDGTPAQANKANNQVARVNDKCMATIVGCDQEISSSDKPPASGMIKNKSPLKKRWRKPVKVRSINSLM